MKSSLITRSARPFDPVSRHQRAQLARFGLIAVLGLIATVFFRLQILEHDVHVERSTENQVRTIPLPAPRGVVYDRDGEVIAENLPAYSASLLPASEEELQAGMQEIAPILELDREFGEELVRQYRLAPGRPILVDDDLDYRTLSLLEERRGEIPGLLLQPKPRRAYPHARATAHLTGYVAQINEKELAEAPEGEYAAGDILGKTGLERMYEGELRGEKGAEFMEVDALGRRVGPWSQKSFEAPDRGEDLTLTVDLDLQRRAAEIFPQGMKGAAVAIDPKTGEVLLLYSHPTFDPNVFSGRMSSRVWRGLVDDPARPLLNRAVQARYPPGSIFKLATAAMAMTLGIMNPDEFEDVPCRGGYQFGSRWFGCHAVHGWATLTDAIITSCDTYFYQIGLKLGLEELTRFGVAWDFAGRTGIDLPNEVEGIFPESPEWYDEHYGARKWGPGVVLNLSIGQGEIAVTPLKMAQFVSAVLNGGDILQPRIRKTDEPPIVRGQLPLSSEQFSVLAASLGGVVNDWRGTAFVYAQQMSLGYTIGGKSGTAEHAAGEPHAWFVAAGPMEDPSIVVAIIVEDGGSGSERAPIAIELVQTYLDGRRGVLPDNSEIPAPIVLSEKIATEE